MADTPAGAVPAGAVPAGSERWPRRSVAEVLAGARRHLRRVDPSDAAAVAADGGVLVDIRPLGDRLAEGEIPGAWVVDSNVLLWRLDPQSPDRLPGVDDSFYRRDVIVVCNEGYASSLAARALQELGLAGASDLDGGYRAWKAQGFPTVPGGSWSAAERPPE